MINTPGESESVDGHIVGTSQDTYISRYKQAAGPLERARRPLSIVVASGIMLVLALCALGIGSQQWINPDGFSTAGSSYGSYGDLDTSNSGQASSIVNAHTASVMDFWLGLLFMFVWAALAVGIWKGVAWVRRVAVAFGLVNGLSMLLPLNSSVTVMDHVLFGVGAVGALVTVGLLLLPNRAWFDWRRHGAAASRA